MPPKKNRKSSKKKNTTNSNHNQSSTSNSTVITNPNPIRNNTIITHPPPSFFLDDSDDDIPFNPYQDYDDYGYDIYDYDDYDDFTNPFDPSYHNFIKEEDDDEDNPTFTFKAVEDLDVFIIDGGKETSEAMLKLPLDIFLDIISRLPIKPLAVCRCVCKTWGSIVHHPRFIKMHHINAIQHLPSLLFHVSVSLMYELKDTDSDSKQVFSEIFLLEHEKEDKIEKGVLVNPQFMPSKVDIKASDLKFEVVGSCNGLVCLAEPFYYDPIYVCNPVIGEYMTLPASPKKMGFEIVSGIGFDEVANEYKVLRSIFNFMDLSSSPKMEVEVCTLGSNKWRKLGNFCYPRCRRSSQVLVKGALHWMAKQYGASELIIAFDVGKEEFQVVPPPPDFIPTTEDCESCELHLGELGGHLCLFSYSFHDRCEVWVMKEYGITNSWTKEYVISRNVLRVTEVQFTPVTLMTNGNILMVINNQSLVCYDPAKKRFRKLKIRLPPWFEAITHVGSFISLRDFVVLTDSKPCINTGGWYGVMKSITSQKPEFDIEGWKLNEQLRRLWWESH